MPEEDYNEISIFQELNLTTKGFSRFKCIPHFQLQNPLYFQSLVYIVSFGFYNIEQERVFYVKEVEVKWFKSDEEESSTPILTAADLAWDTLSLMPELVEELGNYHKLKLQPDQFCQILKDVGFVQIGSEKVLDDPAKLGYPLKKRSRKK